jgi:hypothetical protein
MGAEQPAAAAGACIQLQSADNVLEAERQWEEHCIAGLLRSFREEVVEDRCCIADIAGEGVVRIYFQISIISVTISIVYSLSLSQEGQIRWTYPYCGGGGALFHC